MDDAHSGGSRGAVASHRLPCLDVFLDDGAADGGGDGVVVHGILGVIHRQLGAEQVVAGCLHLTGQAVAGQLDDIGPGPHGAARLHAEGGHRAGGGGGKGLGLLVGQPGRTQGADPVHRSGGRLGRRQAAVVGHRDGHRTHQQAAAAQGIGPRDGADGTGDPFIGTVQGHLGGLTHREAGCIRRREIQRQQHHALVPDGGDLLSGRDHIARGHTDGHHRAPDVGADILGVHRILIAALGLVEGQLGPCHAVGGVRAVDGIQHVPGLDHIPFLEIGGEDGAPHQRLDFIGVGRRDGPRIAEHVGDAAPLGGILQIGNTGGCGGSLPGHQEGARHHQDHRACGDPLPVPFEKGLEPLARAAGGLLGLRLSLLFFLEHGFFSSFCFRAYP